MTKASWFTVRNASAGTADISIFGDIGGFGISAKEFKAELDALGPLKTLRISLNSGGGDVFQGNAMFNILMRNPAKKIITVDGLAASMASVLFMAGDVRIMPENSLLMIHNPVGGIEGQSQEIISFGEMVGQLENGIVNAYEQATSLTAAKPPSRKQIVAMMDAQTWITAQEAVSMGFATQVEAARKIAAKFDISGYRNAPKTYGAAPKWVVAASRDLPISTDQSWDGSAAKRHMLDAANIGTGNGTPDPAKAKKGFLIYDSANPNLRGSYLLPFADLVGGKLEASPAGLRAAASRLPQTSTVPASVRSAARKVIDAYQAKMKGTSNMTNKNPDDFEGDLSPEQIAEEARAKLLKDQKDVNTLCRLAGKPELAAKFNEDGKAPDEVRDALAKIVDDEAAEAAKNGKKAKGAEGSGGVRAYAAAHAGGADISARHNPRGDEAPVVIDSSKIYDNWNRSGRDNAVVPR